jgi:V8-like Glu-specific endopeptidase
MKKEKWLSAGNDDLSDEENILEIGKCSMGEPRDSLPIDEKGNLVRKDFERKVIIDKDEREKVKIMEYPYNCIALLLIEREKMYYGTGFFVSKRCIATAGHCVFDNGIWAKSVTVIPGANIEGYPTRWGKAKAIKLRSVIGWVNNVDPEYDYGAVILPDDSLYNKMQGIMGYAEYNSNFAINVELSGYPEDKSFEQYFATGKIDRVAANRLYYTLDTEHGQSGSPVFVRDNGNCVAVGIHRGNTNSTENHAIRVNNDVMCRWQEWSNL